jgi:septum site-determining protein MinD
VFDADFTKRNMIDHLDIHNIPVSVGQVLNGDAHMTDAIYKHVTGLRIIPSTIHSYDNLSYHYQDLLGDYDYIILDTPIQLPHLEIVLQNAGEALIVHGPDYSSKFISDAVDLLYRLRVLNLGILLNNFSEKSVNELYDYPVLEKIPTDNDVISSFKMKNPVVQTHPNGNVSKKFHRLAKRLS